MKHLLLCIAILLMCLPAWAQDPTAEATQDASPVTVNIEAPAAPVQTEDAFPVSYLLAGLLVVSILFNGYASGLLSRFIHPDAAKGLMRAGIQLGLEAGRNEAARTQSQFDDRLLEVIAGNQGYEFVQRDDGRFVLTKRLPPVGSAAMAGTDTSGFVTTSTHTLVSPATQTPTQG